MRNLPYTAGSRCLTGGPSILLGILLLSALTGGCAAPPESRANVPDRTPLTDRAVRCLKAAVDYRPNAVVRVAGVEALQLTLGEDALPWIRLALSDDVPAVRFAACVALGTLRDRGAFESLRQRVSDPDASVVAGAVFALHRMGETGHSGRLAEFLLDHPDVTVRRNAALLLGLTGEPGAVKVLAKAMRDSDHGVREHALEAMARLGNREAAQELVFMTNSGTGSNEAFALGALEATKNRQYADTFRYKLANAPHLETQLVAARALGRLGNDEGLALALRSAQHPPPPVNDPADPPDAQNLRIRQLAAAALGAIGKSDALTVLERMMDGSGDPRLQVSAAKAILEINLRASKNTWPPQASNPSKTAQ